MSAAASMDWECRTISRLSSIVAGRGVVALQTSRRRLMIGLLIGRLGIVGRSMQTSRGTSFGPLKVRPAIPIAACMATAVEPGRCCLLEAQTPARVVTAVRTVIRTEIVGYRSASLAAQL